jgi:hypothetical protein
MLKRVSGRVRLVAVVVVLLALAMAIVSVAVGIQFARTHADEADVTAAPSLPRRIGAPAVFSRDGLRSPIGAASVVFSGEPWNYDSLTSDTAITGARGDAYRRISAEFGSIAGFSAILSPDGRLLAVQDAILDLTTGTTTRLPREPGADYRVPEAWSPDGRYLATVSYTQSDRTPPDTYSGEWVDPVTRAVLAVTDVATKQETTIATLLTTADFDGWMAAFSPDGTRLAYQTGDHIAVVTRTGTPLATLSVPAGTRIAGKGAWTSDGRGIAVVAEQSCDCQETYPSRWTLSTIDSATGAPMGNGYSVDGVVAIRMLGWSAAGAPIVVSYDPVPPADRDPGAVAPDFRSHADPSGVDQTGVYLDGIEGLSDVATVQVVALDRTGPPRILLASTSDGAQAIDVADDVLSTGLSRPGRPPFLTWERVFGAGVVTGFGMVGAAIVITIVLAVRLRRRRFSGRDAAAVR